MQSLVSLSNEFTSYATSLTQALSSIRHESLQHLFEQFHCRINSRSSIYIVGNGGSAANAHHIAGDYTKCFALAGVSFNINCLSDNACYLTAAANDVDFSEIYEILIGTRILPGDMVVFLSGSGNSMNLVKAVRAAMSKDIYTASITAYDGGALARLVDLSIHVDVQDMEIAEDMQLIIMHFIKQQLLASRSHGQHGSIMQKYNKRIQEGLIA